MILSHPDMVLRMATALALGGAIGYERGRTDHPAGLRTHILVALASATFMLISSQLVYFFHYTKAEPIAVDPSRIASGVVMGMGFLGAGSILRQGFDIHGLTTAASLWLTSAIGLAAGCGMYAEAVIATGATLFVLVGLNVVEASVKKRVRQRVRLELGAEAPDRAEILNRVRSAGAEVSLVDFDENVVTATRAMTLELTWPSAAVADPGIHVLQSLPGLRALKLRGHPLQQT
jgi:putative Mg2+ transporter-C (MgtC) family protein